MPSSSGPRSSGPKPRSLSSHRATLAELDEAAAAGWAALPTPEVSVLDWLLQQPPVQQPRSKAAIDAELAAERDW